MQEYRINPIEKDQIVPVAEKMKKEGQKQREECEDRMRRLKKECDEMIEKKRNGKVCWDNETNRRT